ncbi:hypothetical protein MVEN_02538400 [Mycena venus]|uniref:DUF6534 domain-containing protein n=1 Tax=Mycena venus TaxID=2733690 RepID=A0A8H6U484_9AGAR|nr:hypothetical protein MVEN_02538400 [Mycena venus]
MSLPALDTITGALLIGTWANSFLYMAELFQARYYFGNFKHDDWKLKTFVSVAFLVDSVGTVGDFACVYLYTITHAGDPVYLIDQHWPMTLHLITTAVVAILVQSFLVVRYWRFTRNILVTFSIVFLIFVAFGSSFACGVIIAMFPAFKDRNKVVIPCTLWLVTEAVADISIAAALIWQFKKARPYLVETSSILDRLMLLTMQTGTATATIAAGALVAFLLNEESNVCVGIAYTLGRVYMLSMLANLNVRSAGGPPSVIIGGASSDAALGSLTFPSTIVTDHSGTVSLNGRKASSPSHNTVNIGPQEVVTFTSSPSR